MAKLRIQVQTVQLQSANGSNSHERINYGLLPQLKLIYSQGGIRGLFKGATTRVSWHFFN